MPDTPPSKNDPFGSPRVTPPKSAAEVKDAAKKVAGNEKVPIVVNPMDPSTIVSYQQEPVKITDMEGNEENGIKASVNLYDMMQSIDRVLAQNESQSEEINRLLARSESQSEEISRLLARNESQSEENSRLHDRLEAENKAHGDKINGLLDRMKIIEDDNIAKGERIQELQDQIDIQNRINENQRGAIRDLQAKNRNHCGLNQDLQTRVRAQDSLLDDTREEIQRFSTSFNQRIDNLRSPVNGRFSQRGGLEGEGADDEEGVRLDGQVTILSFPEDVEQEVDSLAAQLLEVNRRNADDEQAGQQEGDKEGQSQNRDEGCRLS